MKQLKIRDLISPFITSLILGFVSWYVLNSLYYAIAYFILLFVGNIYVIKYQKENIKLFKNIDASYTFTNLMNVAMLSSKNIYEGYKQVENHIHEDFANIANEDMHMQLTEIAEDYNLNSFKMYINTMLIYDTDGGNFKELEAIPTSLMLKTKIYYNKLYLEKKAKLAEISTLYFLFVLVLVFMKASITNFYDLMMENTIYQLVILLILIAASVLYFLSVIETYKNKIRGM